MPGRQAINVRDLPSLDDDLQRLRPEGASHANNCDDDSVGDSSTSGEAPGTSLKPATRLSGYGENALSRPDSSASAASLAPLAPVLKVSKSRRRVKIQGGGGGGDAGGASEAATAASQQAGGVRLPGQTHSFTTQPAAGGPTRSQSSYGSGKLPTGASQQANSMSLGRLNSPALALPPDDLPQLHSAAWFNDLDSLLEILKTTSEPLRNLIWYNKQLYPPKNGAAAPTPASSTAPATAARRPQLLAAPLPLPRDPTPVSAAAGIKALLQRDYLRHACHPLAIAAAHGNERMVDEILKAMAEDGRANDVEYPITWHSLPEELPPGCPWVTPLAAAALGGSGECVRLLSQAVGMRRKLTEDRSVYGCFRFRPIVVAQTAEAVQTLFSYGTCHPDTLRYSICDAARRLAKLDFKAAARQQPTQSSRHNHHKHQRQPQPTAKQPKRIDTDQTDGDDDAQSQDSAPDSPRNTAPAAPAAPTKPESTPLHLVANAATTGRAADTTRTNGSSGATTTGAGGSKTPAATASTSSSSPSGGTAPRAGPSQAAFRSARAIKAAELMLFRARLFHDCLGRPLAKSLYDLQQESLASMAALTAMVDLGLQPDRFLSHAEHPNITSTSLLMILVRNYSIALKAASRAGSGGGGGGGGGGVPGRGGGMPPSPGAPYSSAQDPALAASLAGSLGASNNNWAYLGASDLLSSAHEVLNALIGSLLAAGAVVDDPPRMGVYQVGGYHIATAHGPEAAMHHAFTHGPQELVVRLLQYSSLQPEAHEDLVKAAIEAGGAGGADGEEAGGSREGHATAAATFYSRKSTQDVSRSLRRSKVPWEGGRSSPLLAFGAKMQSALIEGNLPLWLHSGRFSELMEDLIKCTIASDAYMVTSDLTWLVAEVFERCMAHEFDNLIFLRNARRSISGDSVSGDRSVGAKGQDPRSSSTACDNALRTPAESAAPGALDALLSGSTVISIEPEGISPAPASFKAAASAEGKPAAPVGGQGDAWAENPPQQPARPDSADSPAVFHRGRRSDSSTGDGRSSGSSDLLSSDVDSDEAAEDPEEAGTAESSSEANSGEEEARRRVPRRKMRLARARTLIRTPEDNVTLTIVYSLYRHTADALTGLHQDLKDGSLDGPLASMSGPLAGAGGTAAAAATVVACNAALVDWAALLRLVARIAATTLNPPKSYGAAASQISVFTTAKAVNQLLYARDWTAGQQSEAADGAEAPTSRAAAYNSASGYSSVIDIDLLRAVAKRYPHEAARLLHGMDLMRVELKGYRWDSIPMSLDQDFYAVLTRGEKIKISGRLPTVAPASVAAAAEEVQRQALACRAKSRASAVVPVNERGAAGLPLPLQEERSAEDASGGAVESGESLTREDILQACIFANMWTVLTHCVLSSRRLPAYMQSLEKLRLKTYRFAVMAQVLQYGSIPVVLSLGLLLASVGLLARGLQVAVRLAGNLVLAVYGRLEEHLQPAMHQMGKRLQLSRVQRGFDRVGRGVGRIVRRMDKLAHRATGNTVLTGSTALMTVRIIPHYLAFLGVLLDPDALAEVWLGVTQLYHRRQAHLNEGGEAAAGGGGGGAGDDDAGPAYLSGRTTRVVCSRVPLSCAAAMPSALLYKLASSPQVNGELFSSPLMRAVITWRWRHFTRYFLLLQLLEHLVYMALFMIYAFSLSYSPALFTTILGESRTAVVPRADCVLPPSGLQRFLLFSLGVMTMTCVVQEFRQILFFKLGWLQQPWNLLDFVSTATVGTIICSHLTCNADAEWLRGLAAIEVALLFIRLLYFAMADDRLGSFFRMVIEVLRDCWLFFVFLGILFTGWGLALSVMQGQNTTILDIYLQLFTMIFGDFQISLLKDANAGSTGLNHLWRMFASVYQIIVTIILLNLLIAIINDSFERINDNEARESLRNKLTLIVEAESVLPAGLAKRMLESLAATDLYVITAEAATVVPSMVEGDELVMGAMPRRTLHPPSRWSGRMGETKRLVSAVADQLTSSQLHFQTRVLAMLSGLKSSLQSAGGEASAAGVGMPGSGLREGAGMASGRGQRMSGLNGIGGVGGGGLGAGGMRGAMSGPGQGASGGMGDSEALEEALDKLLRDRLAEVQRKQEEGQRKQEEALRKQAEVLRKQQEESMAAFGRKLNEALEGISERTTRAAAHAAAAATQSAGMVRAGSAARAARRAEIMPLLPPPPVSVQGTNGIVAEEGDGDGGPSGGGAGGGSEMVLVERSTLELIAQRAAEQAAHLAVQKVLHALGHGKDLGLE